MRGVLAQAGFSAASSFTQAHQTATAKLRLVSETMSINYEKQRSQALIGRPAQHEFVPSVSMVQGDLVIELSYDDDDILEYCMGDETARTYEFANELEKFFHLTIDRGTTRFTFRGCMVNSFTISGEAGEAPVQLSMSLVAYAGTTTGSAFPSLSDPGAPVYFSQLSHVYLGDQADALSGSDELYVKSVSYTCNNNLQIDGVDSAQPTAILQPIRNGFREVSATFGLARYYDSAPTTSIFGWKNSGTALQSTTVFQSGSDSYTIYLPNAKISESNDFAVGGPSALEGDLTLEAFYNGSTNSYMSGVADQMEIVAA
jgi:hypothetical protein